MAARAKARRGTLVRRPVMSAKTPARNTPGAPVTAIPPTITPYRPTPVASTPPVLPPDAGYEQTMAALVKARDSTVTNLGAQRAQGMLNYGYRQDSPNGPLAFDATNPFSQAAILKRNFDQAHTANTTNYAAQGQLYSGALQNAQDETGRQELQQTDALQKSLLSFLAANTQAQTQAGFDYEAGAGQAKGDAIARAPSNPAYTPVIGAGPAGPPASPAAAAKAPAAFKSVPGKDSKNRPGVWHLYPDGRRVFVRK